jgi:hypothetical protein
MHVALQKKELMFNEDMLSAMVDWLAWIRISPALLSYMS